MTTTRMKVFLSVVWDLYFVWRYECKYKMMPGEFYNEVKKDLAFMFLEGEEVPDFSEAVKALFLIRTVIEDCYQSTEKRNFVEKYCKLYM